MHNVLQYTAHSRLTFPTQTMGIKIAVQDSTFSVMCMYCAANCICMAQLEVALGSLESHLAEEKALVTYCTVGLFFFGRPF